MSKRAIVFLLILGVVIGSLILSLSDRESEFERQDRIEDVNLQAEKEAKFVEGGFNPDDYGTYTVNDMERVNLETPCIEYGGEYIDNFYYAVCEFADVSAAQEYCDFIDTGLALIPDARQTILDVNECVVEYYQP